MKLGFTAIALAALLSSSTILSQAALAQQQQSAVPDAPVPQAPQPFSADTNGPITPGKGAGDEQPGANSSSNPQAQQQPEPVSYTHLDVYKRQRYNPVESVCIATGKAGLLTQKRCCLLAALR